jgi:hypothetical protein
MSETGPRVGDADVRRFEEQLGHELPEDYRAFLLEINGGSTSSSHCVFRLRHDETVLNSLYSLNAADERDDLTTRQLYPRYPSNNLPKEALAIGYDDGGGRIVLPLAGPHRGEIWYLDTADMLDDENPRIDWFERRDVWKLADRFAEFLSGLRPLDDAVASTTP